MKNRILIDASHSEETRVVVLNQDVIENYEFQVKSKEELKGNIYIGKITKVEASLQAAFVDYGEKKHGFLPFDEININYFDIDDIELQKIKDKQKSYKQSLKNRVSSKNTKNVDDITFYIKENGFVAELISNEETPDQDMSNQDFIDHMAEENSAYGTRFGYKISDVIKQDTYVLVQVVKDERGHKGASLTTYLSIAGRYSVLMPDTIFEGSMSKKITNYAERKRLKNIISELDIPEDVNLILRTASVDKTSSDIANDYKCVNNIWLSIKEQSSKMKKPGLLFEEGDLVKRVVRDIYSNKIDEIVIEGKKAFDIIKNFANLIAPDIVKKIRPFNNKHSIFKYFKVHDQIESIYSPVVFLPSGGYLVINITEALTAIDINSGKLKGRRNVEETALQTNLEACDEILRQVRLRDLGGLIVIDFIDMENNKNKSIIEKKMKELAREDKAKIRMSEISEFGLLEISRQRIKTSVIERSFHVCNNCQGMGYVRPLELNAVHILRNITNDIENRQIRNYDADSHIVIKINEKEAFYILNNKRKQLSKLEDILKTSIKVEIDNDLPYPFYKVVKENNLENVIPETVLFLEKELEINAEKAKQVQKNNKNNKNIKQNNTKKFSNNNKRSNYKNNHSNKFKANKKIVKKSFLRKLFGM